MNKLALALIVVVGLLSGCLPYGGPSRGGGEYHGDRDHDNVAHHSDHDRDGDGVSDRNDRRPNDPHRY